MATSTPHVQSRRDSGVTVFQAGGAPTYLFSRQQASVLLHTEKTKRRNRDHRSKGGELSGGLHFITHLNVTVVGRVVEIVTFCS